MGSIPVRVTKKNLLLLQEVFSYYPEGIEKLNLTVRRTVRGSQFKNWLTTIL